MAWWWCGRRRFGLMVSAGPSKRSWQGKLVTPDTASPPLCACSDGERSGEAGPSEGVYWLEGKRMKRLTVIVARAVALGAVTAAILGGSALAVQAQTPTLGEVAKKEADRRKSQPAAGKVYTNKDLPASAQAPAAA